MSHSEIFKKFNNIFSGIVPEVNEWFANGKDSIRVRIKNGSDFIFTYKSDTEWKYETLDSYIHNITIKIGGSQMNVGLHDNINKNE